MGKKRANAHYDFIRDQYHKELITLLLTPLFMSARALKLLNLLIMHGIINT